jgi:hypothetical protein
VPPASEFSLELDRLTAGSYSPLRCLTEADWHQQWHAGSVSSHPPLVVALLGGALADRLDWVFHAGYQGMMRYAFPYCPQSGWASYLVAEDKTGEFPGAELTMSAEGRILVGFKSWVAASEHVDHLLVKARQGDAEIVVLLASDDTGVRLKSREKPGFLSDLSQGFAAFEDVPVASEQVFPLAQLHENFSYAEALHVLVALNAFMISQVLKTGEDADILQAACRTLQAAGDLVAANVVGDDFFFAIVDLDLATTETAQLFERHVEQRDPELFERWQQGRGVVNMFSRGLKKRAAWLRDA